MNVKHLSSIRYFVLASAFFCCLTTGCANNQGFFTGRGRLMNWLSSGAAAQVSAANGNCLCEECVHHSRPQVIQGRSTGHLASPAVPPKIEPVAHLAEHPPMVRDDTAYSESGPVHGGSQLVEQQKPATEWALEYQAANEVLRLEALETKEQLAALGDRVSGLATNVEDAREKLGNTQKQLASVKQDLSQWKSQTVEMYSTVKADELRMLAMLRELTATVDQMTMMQQTEPAPSSQSRAPSRILPTITDVQPTAGIRKPILQTRVSVVDATATRSAPTSSLRPAN